MLNILGTENEERHTLEKLKLKRDISELRQTPKFRKGTFYNF